MIYQLSVPGPIKDVDEVRVLEWQGDAGKQFAAGDLIVELETHKAIVEVRAGQPGFLRKILCEPGSWEAIGRPLAIMSDGADETLPSSADGLAQASVQFEII